MYSQIMLNRCHLRSIVRPGENYRDSPKLPIIRLQKAPTKPCKPSFCYNRVVVQDYKTIAPRGVFANCFVVGKINTNWGIVGFYLVISVKRTKCLLSNFVASIVDQNQRIIFRIGILDNTLDTFLGPRKIVFIHEKNWNLRHLTP